MGKITRRRRDPATGRFLPYSRSLRQGFPNHPPRQPPPTQPSGTPPDYEGIFPRDQSPVMDSPMQGSDLVALDRASIDDLSILLRWTSGILHNNAQEEAYAFIIGKMNDNNEVSATILLGFPDLEIVDPVPPPINISYEYRKDFIENLSTPILSAWSKEEVHDNAILQLSSISLGRSRCITEGGSFGGYIVSKPDSSHQSTTFGLTAAHCLPECVIGTEISSPSSLELTSRLEHIIRYTRYSPNQLHIRDLRNTEVGSLLARYPNKIDPNGVEVLLPEGDNSTASRVTLSGSRLGTFAGSQFKNQPGLLHQHNLDLLSCGLNTFPEVSLEQSSLLDWAAFSVEAARYGGNVITQEGDHITQVTLLQPGDIVTKTGRTTAETHGRVNGITVQVWRSGNETREIAIVSTDVEGSFGGKGDSGAALLVEREGLLKAAGMLTGKNRRNEFVVVTPLQAVLRDVGTVFGGTWEWNDKPAV